MARPDLTVEIAWTDNYLEPYPVWTDITDRVDAIQTRQGRNQEIGSVETGTLQLTLDNADGAFTPKNAASPFYPNVKPRRQVRIRTGEDNEERAPVLTNLIRNPRLVEEVTDWNLIPNEAGESDPISSIRLWLLQAAYPDAPGGYTLPGEEPAQGDFTSAGGSDIEGVINLPHHSMLTDYMSLTSIERYPGQPGDRISIYGEWAFYREAGAEVNGSDVRGRIDSYDINGDLISSAQLTVVQVAGADGGTWKIATGSNYPLPAGTATWAVRWDSNAYPQAPTVTNLTSAVQGRRFAVYNHGQSDYAWENGVEFFDGYSRGDLETGYSWEGAPYASASHKWLQNDPADILFRGYVERWPLEFQGALSTTTVTCSDWLLLFSDFNLNAAYDHEILSRSPWAYFPMQEDSDTRYTSAFDPGFQLLRRRAYEAGSEIYEVTGNEPPTFDKVGSLAPFSIPDATSIRPVRQVTVEDQSDGDLFYCGVFLNANLPEPISGDSSFSFTYLYKYYGAFPDNHTTESYEAYEWILKDRRYTAPLTGELFLYHDDDTTGNEARIALCSPTGKMYTTFAGFMPSTENYPDFVDKGWPVTVSWDNDLGMLRSRIATSNYTNQGAWTDGDTGLAADPEEVAEVIRSLNFDRLQLLGRKQNGWIGGYADHGMSHFAIYDYALTPMDHALIREAAFGRRGESADQRIDYMLDQTGWPQELRRMDSDDLEVEGATWETGAGLLDKAREVANDTLGLFFIDRDGQACYQSRNRRIRGEVAHAFDNDAGTGIESGLRFEVSEDDLINAVELSNAYGIKTTAVNHDSVEEYGEAREALETRLASSDVALQMAFHKVNRYGDPEPRIDAVTVRPSAQSDPDGVLWDVVKGARISDKVRLSGLPSSAPATELDFFIEEIQHTATRAGETLDWVMTMQLSPAIFSEGWILGTDNTRLHV